MDLQTDTAESRMVYIDNFRVFLTFMVIVHHAAIAYGGSGGWGVRDPNVDPVSAFVLPIFNGLNQTYFMSAFFLLAGYFTPASLAKKGTCRFLVDRCLRLGIPLLLYTTVGYPMTIRLVEIASGQQVNVSREFGFHAGHLWFLEALLIFSFAYVGCRPIGGLVRHRIAKRISKRIPKNRMLAVVVVILTIVTFLTRVFFPIGSTVMDLQLGHFPHYIFCFFIGDIVYRQRWLDSLDATQIATLRRVALIAMPQILVIGLFGGALTTPDTFEATLHGGFYWQSFAYAAWETVLMITLILSLLHHFQLKHNHSTSSGTFFAANAYAVYLLHQTVLLGINAALLSSAMPSVLKLIGSVAATVVVCLAVSSIIRKVPLVRQIV